MSTYCRNCGVHLQITKGKASLAAGPQLSGISQVRVVSDLVEESRMDSTPDLSPGDQGSDSETWIRTSAGGVERNDPEETQEESRNGNGSGVATEPPELPAADEETDLESPEATEETGDNRAPQASVAEVFGLTADSVEENGEIEVTDSPGDEEGLGDLGKDAAPMTELGSGSMEAMISDLVAESKSKTGSTVKKIALAKRKITSKRVPSSRDLRSRTHSVVRCFRCNHCQEESIHAESTQCGRCNTYINLADFTTFVSSTRTASFGTRGNVVVHRRGSLDRGGTRLPGPPRFWGR